MFLLWGMTLLGVIYWQTATTMTARTDKIVEGELDRLSKISLSGLPKHIDEWVEADHRHVNAYGLFDVDGRPVAGNLNAIPDGLLLNKIVYDVKNLARSDRFDSELARVIGVRLDDGMALIVARDVTFLLDVREIILKALLWGSVAAVVMGFGGALIYGFGPMWRINAIRRAAEAVQSGELTARLPVSSRHDELDLLAGTVNTMLDEVERLLGEVKHVTDAIAHDLKTPLTRLRGHLHRLRDAHDASVSIHNGVESQVYPLMDWALKLDEAIDDTDVVLARFRALMRISEIEDRHRTTDFSELDLNEIGRQAYDLYEAVAESKCIRLDLTCPEQAMYVRGDKNLLFEAVANLIDNSIKFTPEGGRVHISIRGHQAGPTIEVADSGPGIAPADRDRVLARFYRGRQDVEGSGLGLSITAAIVRLHRFTLSFGVSDAGGLKAVIGPSV